MAPTLYLRSQPRAFFLLTDTHALVFRQPSASESSASRSVVIAEFLPIDEVDMRGLVRASRGRTVEGVLGVTSVPTERSSIPEIFLLLVSSASTLSSLLPSSSLRPARVIAVEFHSLSSSTWDASELAGPSHSAYSVDDDLDDPYGPHASSASGSSSTPQQTLEHPCTGMRKYLESGSFFFAEECKWD
ncbi:MAG: inositol polyphosphate 5-phosphatase, partial [Tremellales sp. Tagirdzhanova-0007]